MTRSIVWPTVGSVERVDARRRRDLAARPRAGAALADCSGSRWWRWPPSSRRRCCSPSAHCWPTSRTRVRCQLMGTATDQTMIDRFDLQRSSVRGPDRHRRRAARRRGARRPGLRLAVGGGACLRVSGAVSEGRARTGRAGLRDVGVPGVDGSTRRRAGEYDARVSAFVGDDDDLIGYVSRLESLADSGQLDDDEDDDDDDGRGRRQRTDRRHPAQQRRTDGRGRAVPPRPGRRPAS